MGSVLTSRDRWQIAQAADCIADGGLLAYPTEAIYGLGCNPLDGAAVSRLLAVKRRPVSKGLILIASHWAQLEPFLLPVTASQQKRLLASWPGPNTWVIPCRPQVPRWLRGHHDSLAVRITAHPLAAALCDRWGGALVSTSANRSTQPPCRTPLQVRLRLGADIDGLLNGPLGDLDHPTTIRDLASGRVLRAS